MKTILIGMLLGSLVTSEHDGREACEGRKAMLAEKGVTSLQCVAPPVSSLSSTGTTILNGMLCYDGRTGGTRSC
jgi:hypothetical protein